MFILPDRTPSRGGPLVSKVEVLKSQSLKALRNPMTYISEAKPTTSTPTHKQDSEGEAELGLADVAVKELLKEE